VCSSDLSDKRDGMNLMKNISILFSSLILLVGCSGKSGETETAFQVKLGGLASIASVAGGGAMIYGNSPQGSFGQRIDNVGGEVISLPIPNGLWNFSIIVWDGDNDANPVTPAIPLSGMVRCGVSLGNDLQGGDVTITLSASNDGCSDPVFSPDMSFDSGTYAFPEVVPRTCRIDLVGVADESATECQNENEGFVHSVRYMIIPFQNIGGEVSDDFGNAIMGPCISKNATPGTPLFDVRENLNAVPTPANLPGGNPAFEDSVFKTVVRAYYGENAECDAGDPRGFSDVIFPRGVNEDRPNSRMISFDAGGGLQERAFLLRTPDVVACAPPRGGMVGDFSVGGSKFFFNGICNGAQFDLIPPEWSVSRTFNNKNFILLKNINYFAGVDLSAGEPSWDQHTMIGSDFSTYPGGEPTQYTGIFEGNNKKITGMRMDFEDEAGPISDIGFVRNLGAGGEVRNLTFQMPEIWADSYSDHSYIGIVAGLNNDGAISNVKIFNGTVEGKTNIGLVAGQFGGGTISFVEGLDSEVEGVSSIGGLVGLLVAGTISDSEFRGFVNKDGPDGTCAVDGYSDEYFCEDVGNGNSTWTDANSFGGIAGQANGGSIIASTSKGIVLGHSKVGGIVGSATSAGVNITDSYSICSVIATGVYEGTGSSFVGGIQGEAQSNNNITRSFHTLGSVIGPGNDVGAVSGGGVGTPAVPNSFGTSTASQTLSYASARSVATLTGMGYTNGNGWYMDDDGYDFPRRDFEAVRDCSGKFTGTFAGGDGSEENPFQICSSAQLANISPQIGGNFHYELQRPIDMNGLTGMTSTPYIYNGGASFEGVIHGKGMAISNIAGFLSSPADDIGLFSTIGPNGGMENILLVGAIDISGPTAGHNAGLAAGVNEGVLDRVTAFGSVRSGGDDGFAIGGITGVNKGVIIGARSNAVVQGNNNVGGIAGSNTGGLIAYSVFGGKVTPFTTSILAHHIGGLTGRNNSFGGFKDYYDPSYDETISYDGDIIDSSVYGVLDAQFGPANSDQAAMRKAGLAVGENGSYVSNIEIYGRIFLQYKDGGGADLVPTFTNVDPSTNPGQANGSLFRANIGVGGNVMGLADTYVIGDAVWGHNGVSVKLPDFGIDDTVPTAGSTQILPVYEFGGAVGVNSAAGIIENVFWSGGLDYNGAQYFVPTFGYLVGDQQGTLSNSISYGGFYYPGSNSAHVDMLNGNYLVQRETSGEKLIVEYDTATNAGGTITVDNFTDLNSFVIGGDNVGFGSYGVNVGGVTGTTITHSAPLIDSSINPSLYIPELQFDDTNYPGFFEFDLGWSIAVDYDDPTGHWRVRQGGREAGLVRPEGYEENLRRDDFIDLIQSLQ
jgi:hypothetical protein